MEHPDDTRAGLLIPSWPAPPAVRAVSTLRSGGLSRGPWRSFNLAGHVGDDPVDVAANRQRLLTSLPGLTGPPQWLNQQHRVEVVEAKADGEIRRADASHTRSTGVACAVLTADCLPVLLCDQAGSVVAAAHAGWRGLAAGILRRTVGALGVGPGELLAWLGPAIGVGHFEVGAEVRAAFVGASSDRAQQPEVDACFVPSPARPGYYFGDLYQLARLALARLGVTEIYGGDYCTYRDSALFYSYRRDGVTGRMASLIWLDSQGKAPL